MDKTRKEELEPNGEMEATTTWQQGKQGVQHEYRLVAQDPRPPQFLKK